MEEVGHGALGRGEALRCGAEDAIARDHFFGELAHKVQLVALVVAPWAWQVQLGKKRRGKGLVSGRARVATTNKTRRGFENVAHYFGASYLGTGCA